MANLPQDPSSGIHQDLLPHVHLISTHRYALMPRVDLQDVAKWLMDAPRIAKNQSPFHWTYLDGPVDGTILLTWQPLGRLGTNFASDGFVWASPEQYFKQDLGNGLLLEIYLQKSGFLPGEQAALHARRRFRLVPAQAGNPHAPQPDISLWLVHYGPSEPNDRIPTNVIPFDERVHAMINTRQYLKKCGQIARKDFMLSDRVNWPQIAFPREGGGRQQMYASPMNARGVPQQMAYPPQTPSGPPAKRARHASTSQNHPAPQPVQAIPSAEAVYDDDEDTSRGDMFDQLTAREIALSRYQQNHEWMEEILSSAYRIDQINPPDLGLGFKGQLASLTEGIFPAQGGEAPEKAIDRPYSSNLDPKLAEEFQKRISNFMESSKAEIEAMKANHEKSLAQIKESALIVKAEKDLRDVVDAIGDEPWRLEGRVEEGDDEPSRPSPQKSKKTLEDIVAEVEGRLNRKTQSLRPVDRIQDGGYLPPAPEPEPEPEPPAPVLSVSLPAGGPGGTAPTSQQVSAAPSQQGGMGMDDPDLEMGGTAGELLSQMQPGVSSTSTPGAHNTSALPSAVATPNEIGVPSPGPQTTIPEAKVVQPTAGDTIMGNTDTSTRNTVQTTPDQGTGSGEWVMVPKGGASPDPNAQAVSASGSASGSKGTPAAVSVSGSVPAKQLSVVGTPADGGSATFENDFSSLGDLDTAGDALANYEAPSGTDLGDGLDLNMDMDDSAFGDAFHGVSQSGTPADGNPDGI
ncbi:hypothetical protein jhhlp_007243 [Lomentospora prolificans]|uniref:DUF1750-domain-containing protein n=1 Tax=Lomentospora prolificans TaxID=41688 RepID=A0A2N3N237_9PEZI|nr:hypothetical protein jhhlp_007243 [Lomentospora prolificans]